MLAAVIAIVDRVEHRERGRSLDGIPHEHEGLRQRAHLVGLSRPDASLDVETLAIGICKSVYVFDALGYRRICLQIELADSRLPALGKCRLSGPFLAQTFLGLFPPLDLISPSFAVAVLDRHPPHETILRDDSEPFEWLAAVLANALLLFFVRETLRLRLLERIELEIRLHIISPIYSKCLFLLFGIG